MQINVEEDISEVESEGIFYNPSVIRPEDIRSDGIHISPVIQNLWYIQMKGMQGQDISNASAIIEAGYTWEELLEKAWGFRQHRRVALLEGVRRPGEQKYDRAFMTPDGYDKANNTVHEYKLTTKSASKLANFEDNFLNFIWQAAAYCLALKSRNAVFWIMFIGRAQLNKEDPWKPARVYKVQYEFSEEELIIHWRTLTNHKDWMVKNGLFRT